MLFCACFSGVSLRLELPYTRDRGPLGPKSPRSLKKVSYRPGVSKKRRKGLKTGEAPEQFGNMFKPFRSRSGLLG